MKNHSAVALGMLIIAFLYMYLVFYEYEQQKQEYGITSCPVWQIESWKGE